MLYWYSGTGNSRSAAKLLASLIGEGDCRFIPSALGIDTSADRPIAPQGAQPQHDMLGLCFPVYSWGVPPIVLKLIDTLETESFSGSYVYALLTCGDEAGLAATMLRKALAAKGITLHAAFSVIMPNDYVMLPGFGTDTPALASRKLRQALPRIRAIARSISARKQITDVHRGPFPSLKTRLVYPLFRRWGVRPSLWKADTSKCIGCGKCRDNCPAGNISLHEGRPQWGDSCFSCTACFHICPVRAIDYGCFTRRKQQYFNPGI